MLHAASVPGEDTVADFFFNGLDVVAPAVADVELNLCGHWIFRTHRLLLERSIGD